MEGKNNYLTIYTQLKNDILSGTHPHGALLPTEQQQAETYSVSRPTVSKVYDRLQEEGLVTKKKGIGTIVTYDRQKSRKRLTIGLLLAGSGESEIFGQINDQILKKSQEMQFECLWEGATASNAEIRRNLVESCCEGYIQKKVDGILYTPFERIDDACDINMRICSRIKECGIPLVLLDRDIVPSMEKSEFDVVGLDNSTAAAWMTDHIIDAGCTNVLFVYRPNSAYSVERRLYAVKNRVTSRGLSFTSANDICCNPNDLEAVRRFPVVRGKTGIICANDSTAALLMSSLEDVGYQISKDVLISGFDNMKYSQHLKHALTSMEQPCNDIADISVELLMRRISGNTSSPLYVMVQGQVIKRDSTRFL